MLLYVWVCLCVYGYVVTAGQVDLRENDVCKQEKGVLWTCKPMTNCPKALSEVKLGKNPQICSFKGTEPVVCCEPEAVPPATGAKSEEKPEVVTPPTGAKSEEKPEVMPPATGAKSEEKSEVMPPATGDRGKEKSEVVTPATGAKSEEKSEVMPPATGDRSKAMCKKYGEYVYFKFKSVTGDELINTCYMAEPKQINAAGGVEAEPREYPHMALIGYEKSEGSPISWLCGGSLISERYVLSAAHCATPVISGEESQAKWVRFGEYNIQSTKDSDSGLSSTQDYKIAERIVHPEYKSTENYHDIALFKLAEDVEMTEFVRPACLQTEHQLPNTYAVATGWGHTSWKGVRSDILQKVNLTIISKNECFDLYKNISQTSPRLKNGILDDSMLCAGSEGKDTCQGDSGGPLQTALKEPYCMYSLVGVTSFGVGCATKPGVYTRVSHYIPWIESVVWTN